MAKLVAHLLATAALWVGIQASLKNTKWATYAKESPTHSNPPKNKGDLYLNELCLEVLFLLVEHEDLPLVAGQLAVLLLHQLKLLQSTNHLSSTQSANHPPPVTKHPIPPPPHPPSPIFLLLQPQLSPGRA